MIKIHPVHPHSPAAEAIGSSESPKITEQMRDRLTSALVARLVIREEVVRVLRKLRDGFDDHEKGEIDLAALDEAEKALANAVAQCRKYLRIQDKAKAA